MKVKEEGIQYFRSVDFYNNNIVGLHFKLMYFITDMEKRNT